MTFRPTQRSGEDFLTDKAHRNGHEHTFTQNGEHLVVATCTKCLRHGFVELRGPLREWTVWGQLLEVTCDGGICELTYREEPNA